MTKEKRKRCFSFFSVLMQIKPVSIILVFLIISCILSGIVGTDIKVIKMMTAFEIQVEGKDA